MNAERLLAHYETIADAPDAIARLRRFILDLAVRGKLEPQDANDEPASELLKRIAKEKARLVKAGEIRKGPALQTISPDKLSFELPCGWAWTRLGDVIHLVSGQHLQPPEYSEDPKAGLPYITGPSDFAAEGLQISRFALVRKAVAKKGQLLLTVKGSGVGKTTICDIPEVAISRQLMALTAIEWNDRFLLLITHRLAEKLQVEARSLIPGISREDVDAFVIPLPPIGEQRRIVAKVDELMGLCDRLDAARAGREAVRDQLASASLARLNAPDPETFQHDARFTLDALPALTTRTDQIKALRQTILNLAVRGKLQPQDANDEPASELLKRMFKERKERVARRKIRGATPPKSPSAETEGFDLPTSWELCALGQITLITDPNPSHRYPDYSGGTVPILSTREFAGDNGWNPETAKLTTQAFWEFQQEICEFAEGDIIFARKGRLGLPRFLPPFEKFTFSHTLFSIKPMTGLNPAYLLWLLRRDEVVGWLTNEMNQNTGVPTLGKAKTERLPVPLPPLAEQHRIVAKVDTLMSLCDRLEASLTNTAATRRRLLDALLAEALAPTDARQLEAAE
jgi:type I restriction enzyme S subunit